MYKKRSLLGVSLLVCLNLFAMPETGGFRDTGINFASASSWEQVKEKAAREQKYIFVDCFTTWCGPCKKMEKEVFVNSSVADYVNEKFVSVRLQMDTTDKDSDLVKKWYSIANTFQQEYNVDVFPTYLFFSPNGEVLHKEVGFQEANIFRTLVEKVFDTGEQFYTLLAKSKLGLLNFVQIRRLAVESKKKAETTNSFSLAKTYMDGYINQLDEEYFFRKDNFQFVSSFYRMLKDTDRVFNACRDYPSKVDSVMGKKGYSDRMINSVIYSNEVAMVLEQNEQRGIDPQWRKLRRSLAKKYGKSLAYRQIIDAKVILYKRNKNYRSYTKYLVHQLLAVQKYEDNRLESFFFLNSCAWDIFQYSDRKRFLRKALPFAERAISLTPQYMLSSIIDTKANLLYKLNKKDEAIATEEKAMAEASEENRELIVNTLEKMKKGVPTWFQE